MTLFEGPFKLPPVISIRKEHREESSFGCSGGTEEPMPKCENDCVKGWGGETEQMQGGEREPTHFRGSCA